MPARPECGEFRRCHPFDGNLYAELRILHGACLITLVLEIPQLRLVRQDFSAPCGGGTPDFCGSGACTLYAELQPVPVFPVLEVAIIQLEMQGVKKAPEKNFGSLAISRGVWIIDFFSRFRERLSGALTPLRVSSVSRKRLVLTSRGGESERFGYELR